MSIGELRVRNQEYALHVFPDARFALESVREGAGACTIEIAERVARVTGMKPISGVYLYPVTCEYSSLEIRLEGQAAPVFERAEGQWPSMIEEDELHMYPHLHFVAERKTGTPWRFERWYTLVGSYLVFEAEQYFERTVQRQGKNWERLVVHIRQLMDLAKVKTGNENSQERMELLGTVPRAGLEPAWA